MALPRSSFNLISVGHGWSIDADNGRVSVIGETYADGNEPLVDAIWQFVQALGDRCPHSESNTCSGLSLRFANPVEGVACTNLFQAGLSR